MATQINKTGLVEIKMQVAFGAGPGQLLSLGFSEDMANVEERAFWHNVPGDAHGGPQGPPIDVQYLGSIAVVQIAMSRWDPANFDTIRSRRAMKLTTTELKVEDADVGQLMLEGLRTRIVLDSPTRPRNFPTCLIREAVTYAMGTKYSTAVVQFEAHRTPAGQAAPYDTLADILQDEVVTEYTDP